MLKDVLTILFYATSVYVVLWLTYKFGFYRAEESMADEVARLRQSRWKEGYTIGRERGHKEGYRDGYAKGRAEGYDDGRRYEAITEHNKEQLEKMIAEHDYNIKQS
jgi:flagellar biosynthesis/type III secretory pathway protein FliH